MATIIQHSYPIHKGYVPGKNQVGCEKQPAMKFTEQYFTNLSDVAECPNLLGILNDDIVMIDTDTQEDTQAFIRILQSLKLTVPYIQTDKGFHFYFKDSSITSAQTGVLLACGIVADIKLGNRHGLDLLRKGGVNRNSGYFSKPLMPVPFWALPIKDAQRGSLNSLAGLQQGNRNHMLFSMVGRLRRTGLTYEQVCQTINLINYNVIASPLPQFEINTLCRRESFDNAIGVSSVAQSKTVLPQGVLVAEDKHSPISRAIQINSADEDKKFDPLVYVKEILRLFNVKIIGGLLYAYKSGEYVALDELGIDKLICLVMPESNLRHRAEIRSRLKIEAPELDDEETEDNRKLINFNNGLFNIEDNSLTPHAAKYFVPNRIPHDIALQPINCPELDEFINQISSGNEDTIKQIYEMSGLCLYRRNFIRGCYILVGPKANGKSTFLNFLNYCLGRKNTASMKLHQVSEKFNTQLLNLKLANLGDDISDAYISDASTLKSIITSDSMLVDVKNRQPFMMTPYSTLIFSANTMPRATDATKALLDRIVIVPFTNQFTASTGNLNTDMVTVLHKPHVAAEFLRRAVIALQRVRASKTLTVGELSMEIKREYEIESNSVLSFLTDPVGISENLDEEINNKPLQDLYFKYQEYCRAAGQAAMSRNSFTRNLKHQLSNAKYGCVRQEAKVYRAFMRVDKMAPIEVVL